MKVEELPGELLKSYQSLWITAPDWDENDQEEYADYRSEINKAQFLYSLLSKLKMTAGLPKPPTGEEENSWYEWDGESGFDEDYTPSAPKASKSKPLTVKDLNLCRVGSETTVSAKVNRTYPKTITSGAQALEDMWIVEIEEQGLVASVIFLPQDVPFSSGSNVLEKLDKGQNVKIECEIRQGRNDSKFFMGKTISLIKE